MPSGPVRKTGKKAKPPIHAKKKRRMGKPETFPTAQGGCPPPAKKKVKKNTGVVKKEFHRSPRKKGRL